MDAEEEWELRMAVMRADLAGSQELRSLDRRRWRDLGAATLCRFLSVSWRRFSARLPALFVRIPETRDVVMPKNPDVKPPVEVIPSVAGEISAIASAHAPFLYFEDASAFGHVNGIIRITLEAARILPTPGNQAAQ